METLEKPVEMAKMMMKYYEFIYIQNPKNLL